MTESSKMLKQETPIKMSHDVFLKLIDSNIPKRKFGVEIELNNTSSFQKLEEIVEKYDQKWSKKSVYSKQSWYESKSNNNWNIKTDSSCGKSKSQKGFEVVSYVASGAKDILCISGILDYLKKDFKAGKNCALHVHVNIGDFDRKKANRLALNWMKCEKYLFKFLPLHRQDNEYCVKVSEMIDECYKMSRFVETLKPESHSPHHNDDRKYAVSFYNYYVNYSNRPTVEFRMLPCILNADYLCHWLIFFLYFVENTDNLPKYNSFKSFSSLTFETDIINRIFKNDEIANYYVDFFNSLICSKKGKGKEKK